MDYGQQNSIFRPGLTTRGPVYRGSGNFGALPSLSPTIKYGIIAALLAGAYFKKIPLSLPIAGALGFAVWQFFPDDTTASASAAPAAPIVISNPIPPLDLSTSLLNTPMPSFPAIQQ